MHKNSEDRIPLHQFYNKSEEELKKILSTPCSVLSYVQGTEEDYKISQELENYFAKYFITSQQLKIKEQVLSELDEIIKQWSDQISEERKIVKDLLAQQRARLLPFGSYSLGVSSNEGDIDLVIVAPHFIERETHFNKQLIEIIKANKKVEKCKFVDALNPIITFYYDGQAIDISLGRLDQDIIPDSIDKDIPDEYLRTIDQKDIGAINGRRNNMDCLKSVGNQLETYKAALKALKIWYKAWGLSANRLGYFGGIDMAILVAKICQLFPNLPLNRIIEEFFRIYTQWDWENIPIKIKPYNNEINHPTLKNWEPPTEKGKIYMATLTPSFPCINSIKATYFTHKVIMQQFLNTNKLIQNEINMKQKNWFSLFTPYRFFDCYKRYIQIDILGKGQDVQSFEEWEESCEVKLLKLFQNFDKNGSFFFHPYPDNFKKFDYQTNFDFCSSYFIGVKKRRYLENGQKIQSKSSKLSLKNIIRENFMKIIKYVLDQKQQVNEAYNQFTARIFQTTIDEMIDIEFGDIAPQGVQSNLNYQQKRNEDGNKQGYNENYQIENFSVSEAQNNGNGQDSQNLKRNYILGDDENEPQIQKLRKQSSEIKKPLSQEDLDAAGQFL